MRQFKDKVVRIRKGHACDWCEQWKPVDTKMRYMVGLCAGEFVAVYYCEKCDRELHKGTCYEKIEPGGWEMV